MLQQLKIITLIVILVILLTGGTVLLSKKIISDRVDIQSKQIFEKMRREIERLKKDKEKISKENEKLKADALSYLSFNTRLQNKQEEFTRRLNEIQLIIDTKEADIQKFKRRITELELRLGQEKERRENAESRLLKEKEEFKEQINALQARQKEERALYRYNLAVAFTKAKLYSRAQNTFEESLKFNPDNPEAHYNLGLLYENYSREPMKAALHYRKYLRLKPLAEDKEEVESRIKRILNQAANLNY